MRSKLLFSFLLLTTFAAHAAPYENGTQDTPGQRMPPGEYRCSMGSYAAKPCTVAKRDGRFYLTVAAGARFHFELELYPTDEADQLIGSGTLTKPGELCPDCADDKLGVECAGDLQEKRQCPKQTLTVSLRKSKGGVWKGSLIYYLVRGIYGTADKLSGWYRLGITDELRVAPLKSN